ncbi:MAG: methionyl-tRNA formyltransferase [Bacilli bacterium]
MKDIRAVFMGTPSFAYPILKELINYLNVVLVVCQPDREKDRKGNIVYSPCKTLAIENNIAVFQPIRIKEEYQKIIDVKPDIIITAAYGQIIPKEILNFPKYGAINVHASLLPKFRGGAPIHHAIIEGEKETGVTIMYMDEKMDAGNIIIQQSTTIDNNICLDDLYKKLSYIGRDLLIKTLPSIIDGTNNCIKQDESKVTFGLNITKEEEKINFNDTARNIHNKIRGLSSVPGAYTILKGKRMKIYKSEITSSISQKEPGTIEKITNDAIFINTKDYIIKILDIKIEGKRRCLVSDFINGINKKDYIGVKFE